MSLDENVLIKIKYISFLTFDRMLVILWHSSPHFQSFTPSSSDGGCGCRAPERAGAVQSASRSMNHAVAFSYSSCMVLSPKPAGWSFILK